MPKEIAVIMTSHNRRNITLDCLDALFGNTLKEGYLLSVYLVDDGCIDGTAQSVHKVYPQVNIIKGSGNLFWNRGMHLAFDAAIKKGFDYYLWLNDDTLLYKTAITSLIDTCLDVYKKQEKTALIVGSTQDHVDSRLTYGGVIRPSKIKTTSFSLVTPEDIPVECETMNGNCVLIPHTIIERVGNLEPNFTHAMGDLDYGLRARKAGFDVWVMPGFAGTCSNNSVSGSFNDPSLSITERFRKIIQPKGLPFTSWRIFTQRHAGFFWPAFWLWPYAKVVLKGVINK